MSNHPVAVPGDIHLLQEKSQCLTVSQNDNHLNEIPAHLAAVTAASKLRKSASLPPNMINVCKVNPANLATFKNPGNKVICRSSEMPQVMGKPYFKTVKIGPEPSSGTKAPDSNKAKLPMKLLTLLTLLRIGLPEWPKLWPPLSPKGLLSGQCHIPRQFGISVSRQLCLLT